MAEAPRYYDSNNNLLNTFYSLNIQLQTFFTDLLFPEDSTRIIYSSTAYAFRKRFTQQTQNPDENTPIYFNNLNFPFMNYRGKIKNGTDRHWWNQSAQASGIFIDEIGKKLKYTPVTVQYDSTVYYGRDDDKQKAMNDLIFSASNEVQVPFYINVDGIDLQMPGVLTYKLDDEPTFNEQDWLKMNKIHTIKLDFEVQTIMIKTNDPGTNYCITEQAILNFSKMNPDLSSDELSQPPTQDEIYDTLTVIENYYS